MNKEEFIKFSNQLNINITDDIYNSLYKYYKLLIEWNKKFNLTTIIEENDVFLKHFYDSMCLSKVYDLNKKIYLCDLGTGAGFPGIVLKIIFPNLIIDLIESNNKKCVFLETVIKELNLKNINVINKRAEDYAKEYKEKYDVVTCRAVANLRILLEYSIPLLIVEGLFIPLKGNIEDEIKDSKNTLLKLSSELIKIESYELPIEKSNRNIPVIKKKKESNKIFPRNYKDILKKPL